MILSLLLWLDVECDALLLVLPPWWTNMHGIDSSMHTGLGLETSSVKLSQARYGSNKQ